MVLDIRLSTNYRGTKSTLGFGGFTAKPLSQLRLVGYLLTYSVITHL